MVVELTASEGSGMLHGRICVIETLEEECGASTLMVCEHISSRVSCPLEDGSRVLVGLKMLLGDADMFQGAEMLHRGEPD